MRASPSKAGNSGFQLNVKGNPHLEGAVIASKQGAIDQGLNRFVTGTLTHSDIENHSDYKATGMSLSGGFSIAGKPGAARDDEGGSNDNLTMYKPGKTGVNGGGAGVSSESGKDRSLTRSAISSAQISITNEAQQLSLTGQTAGEAVAGISGDVLTDDGSNGLSKSWNIQELMTKHQLNAQIMKSFGQEGAKTVASVSHDFADKLRDEALAETDPIKQEALLDKAMKRDEGGEYRTGLHAATAFFAGGLPAALGTAAASGAAEKRNEIQDHFAANLRNMGVDSEFAKVASQMATSAMAVGAGMAGGHAAGAAAAFNADFNNRQLHQIEVQWIENNAKAYAAWKNISISQAQQELTAQAHRQVQLGSFGSWDKEASMLLSQSVQRRLPSEKDSGPNHMFYAIPEVRADSSIYASAIDKLPSAENRPSSLDITNGAKSDSEARRLARAATLGAPVVAAAVLSAPLAPAIGGAFNYAIGSATSAGMDAAG